MNNKMSNKKNKISKGVKYFVLAFAVVLFSSCIRLKDTVYLQGDIAKKLHEVERQSVFEQTNYLVKPNDLLYIRVSSLEEKSTAFLNAGSPAQVPNALSASLMGYRVGLDGQIDYPFIGKIPAAGFSLSEIEQRIQIAASKFVINSSVTVKLLNDIVTVLGEVRNPCRIPLNSEEISILEAFAFAGDLTDMANRRRVRIIRNVDGITPQMVIIDVTDEKIMFSSYYRLKPGDIIYVEPKRFKQIQLSANMLSLVVTLSSLGIMIWGFIGRSNNG